MPGPLRYFKRDPQRGRGGKKNRGAGHYYHRGNGVYSKKDDSLDRTYKGTRYGRPLKGKSRKIGSGVYRHAHDTTGKKARKMGLIRPRTPRAPKKIPAFMRKNPRKKTCAKSGCKIHPINGRKCCSKHR